MIKGLHHNAYRCRDSEETRKFYEGFLGLPLATTLEISETKSGRQTQTLRVAYCLVQHVDDLLDGDRKVPGEPAAYVQAILRDVFSHLRKISLENSDGFAAILRRVQPVDGVAVGAGIDGHVEAPSLSTGARGSGGPGAGLVRIDDELLGVRAGEHLVGRGDDGIGELRVEPARLLVRERGGLLDPDLRHHEWPERLEAADREVLLRTHGLHAVERGGGDRELAERVLLDAGIGHEFCLE